MTVTFLAFQQGAISPVTWLMLSEIFPMQDARPGHGRRGVVLWLTNFVIGFVFPLLLAAIGHLQHLLHLRRPGRRAILFAAKYVPETKDKSLEDLEHHFKQLAAT